MRKIVQNFVEFSEKLNFKSRDQLEFFNASTMFACTLELEFWKNKINNYLAFFRNWPKVKKRMWLVLISNLSELLV